MVLCFFLSQEDAAAPVAADFSQTEAMLGGALFGTMAGSRLLKQLWALHEEMRKCAEEDQLLDAQRLKEKKQAIRAELIVVRLPVLCDRQAFQNLRSEESRNLVPG